MFEPPNYTHRWVDRGSYWPSIRLSSFVPIAAAFLVTWRRCMAASGLGKQKTKGGSYECVSKWRWGPKTIHWSRTKNVSTNNTTTYSFLGAGGGGFEILRDTRTCQQVVLYNLDLPPNRMPVTNEGLGWNFPTTKKSKNPGGDDCILGGW